MSFVDEAVCCARVERSGTKTDFLGSIEKRCRNCTILFFDSPPAIQPNFVCLVCDVE